MKKMSKHEDYAVLSQLAYIDIDKYEKGMSISEVVKQANQEDKKEKYTELYSLLNQADWTVKNYENKDNKSDFVGMCFQKKSTGETVFAFRGTDPATAVNTKLPEDLITDLQLAVEDQVFGTVKQFDDAYNFVKKTLGKDMTGI